MWVLLLTRFRRWLLLALVAPALSYGAGQVAARLERRGPTKLTRALRKGQALTGRRRARRAAARRV
jgi:hypothetical protein